MGLRQKYKDKYNNWRTKGGKASPKFLERHSRAVEREKLELRLGPNTVSRGISKKSMKELNRQISKMRDTDEVNEMLRRRRKFERVNKADARYKLEKSIEGANATPEISRFITKKSIDNLNDLIGQGMSPSNADRILKERKLFERVKRAGPRIGLEDVLKGYGVDGKVKRTMSLKKINEMGSKLKDMHNAGATNAEIKAELEKTFKKKSIMRSGGAGGGFGGSGGDFGELIKFLVPLIIIIFILVLILSIF